MSSLKQSGEDVATLMAISDFINTNQFSPSVRDLAEMLGISSTSVVDHRLNVLKRNGWITKADNTARSIVITADGKSVLNAA